MTTNCAGTHKNLSLLYVGESSTTFEIYVAHFLLFRCCERKLLLIVRQMEWWFEPPSSIWIKNEYMSRLEIKMFQINLFYLLYLEFQSKYWWHIQIVKEFHLRKKPTKFIRKQFFFHVSFVLFLFTFWLKSYWPNTYWKSNKEEWTVLTRK